MHLVIKAPGLLSDISPAKLGLFFYFPMIEDIKGLINNSSRAIEISDGKRD
jgi:hypothetical protein